MIFVIDASVPELIVGQYAASLTDNGTGDFTLTLNEPFARAPVAIVSGIVADTVGYSDASTVSTVDVKITDLAGAAADQDVIVEVIGWDAEDEA